MSASDSERWRDAQAPGLDVFEDLAAAAFAALPQDFRNLARDVIIRIEDFPDDETLEAMECETPFDLLGLFQGNGLAQGGGMVWTGQMPNTIFLYRRPILDYWADHEETLGGLITHVFVHEIGHHFGLSDEDMEAIERQAESEGD
ncbi:metallopeptidase family protein [Pseudochelatococcus contaminans]|uniref:Putative Zn-dependent protease with MMP-like domain n=1 Tax=Pseudochelatococcus contaminans TaxID=1538103 RepID=A0A7W5Z2X9_9HYPH|nr:metallopeptidase family protein [Pseudochelatococcus contaminans]MBB3808832.1 putative Zn-dependent protease with MMP-like domain [Pseudochelatococcus contaminans]